MAVITISRSSYSMGREIAEKVAAELGYKCVSRRVLLEASEEFNTPELLLERALHDAPSRLDRFRHGKERFVAYVRQAFLEAIQQDNVVYHGLAGHFFVEGISHVLKVRIYTDLEERIKQEMVREGLPSDEAERRIRKDDRERRDWSLSLYGTDSSDASLYDLVLHVLKIRVDDAVSIICRSVQRESFETTEHSRKALENLLLAARAKSRIVDKWPTADVSAVNGNVLIHVDRGLPSGSEIVDEITERVSPVPDVNNVRVIFYSRRREIKSKEGVSAVLLDKEHESLLRPGNRILVPMANPETQDALVLMARALLRDEGGEIVALSVLTGPEKKDLHAALTKQQEPIEILDHASEISRGSGVGLRPVVRVSPELAQGISRVADEEGCNLIVMGWADTEGTGSKSLMEELLNKAGSDLVFFKPKTKFPPKRIAVALGGSINQSLMVKLAGRMADEFGGEITFLNILPTDYSDSQRTRADHLLADAVRHHDAHAIYSTELLTSDDPLELLAEESKKFDLLIVGTTKVGFFQKAVVGSFAAQVVERAACSVAAVRVISPVRRTLKRVTT